jgi:4-aminobutyrate aminotransferase-like enzyme/Ser/Thr protein kinase RdoA (MazF antagonist)
VKATLSRMTADDAEKTVLEHWGLEAKAHALAGEIDRNFVLVTSGGERRVLKVAPTDTPLEAVECQVSALEFLAETPVAGLVPRVIRARSGDTLVQLENGEGPCWARLVSYLDGTPLVNLNDRPPQFLEGVGRALARLDLALRGFDHPGAHRALIWDIEHADRHASSAERIEEASRRALVERHLDHYRAHVKPRLAGLEHNVIHNDANDHNLLVSSDAGGRPTLAGLIDFGDIFHTITVAEPAISCAYLMLDRDDPLSDAARLVAGYHAVRPLAQSEQALIFDLIVARLCASVLIAAYRRVAEPDNEYLQISVQPVWRLLERLSKMDREQAARKLEDACAPATPPKRTAREIIAVRKSHLGRNLSLAYSEPLKIVRGRGQYLYDDGGRRYLDLVNNVCHVGHCHPRVVEAAHRQMAELNTNTRYLHDNLAEYALRLTATLPEPLSVCYFVCSGTEANDLALRLARAHTGSKELIVLDHAYHGHSPSLVEISPYKSEGPGGEGLATHAHKVPMPDPYRGPHLGPFAGLRYADEVRAAISGVEGSDRKLGAFIAESLIGCGGQVVPADGFLAAATDLVHAAGGVTIADEVQVGFGRVGTHFWAFGTQHVVPDIVTLGKPIGNGHPMAAVITTPEIAASFDTGMEFFSTFGGNPVSCAVGLAVLEVIEREDLQHHALETGGRMLEGLRELRERHPLIGDVRGLGLFIGIELVRDPETLAPAGTEAALVVNEMKWRGFLLSTDGPFHNVIKIKPPMVIQPHDVDATLTALDEVLGMVEGGR